MTSIPAWAKSAPVGEYLLQRATIARDRSEQQIVEAVAARSQGMTWQHIGTIVGTSAQAAQQRHAILVKSV